MITLQPAQDNIHYNLPEFIKNFKKELRKLNNGSKRHSPNFKRERQNFMEL